jgi:hypothetical protein
MFGLGVSSTLRLERSIAGFVLLGLFAGVMYTASIPKQRGCGCPARTTVVAELPAPAPAGSPTRADAERAYRAGDFARAAELADAVRPSDDDLQILAQQYAKLATAWDAGMDQATPALAAYPLLREAWKLDTVLGGVHAERVQARLVAVVPRAALDYASTGDYDNAELALGTAELLGVDDASTRTVARILAEHR